MHEFDTFKFQSNVFDYYYVSHSIFFSSASQFSVLHVFVSIFHISFHFISHWVSPSAHSLSLCVIYEMNWSSTKIGKHWIVNDFLLIIRFCFTFIYLFMFLLAPEYETSTSLHSFVFVDVLPQWFAFPRIAISFGFDSLFIFSFFSLAWLCAKLNRMLLFPHIFRHLALSKRKNIYEIKILRHILALIHALTHLLARTQEKSK